MPTVPREGLPSFWCTAIAKLMSGDQPCWLAPWLAGHMVLEKRPRQDSSSLALWKANHSGLLKETADKYQADGWKCSVERFWKVTGQTSILSGKADLVISKPNNRPTIIDVKSGNERESDVLQVMIQMVMIPLAWKAPTMQFGGKVIYQTHTVDVDRTQLEEFQPKLFALLRQLGTMPKPSPSPSESACRFCEVSDADCGHRFEVGSAEEEAVSSLF